MNYDVGDPRLISYWRRFYPTFRQPSLYVPTASCPHDLDIVIIALCDVRAWMNPLFVITRARSMIDSSHFVFVIRSSVTRILLDSLRIHFIRATRDKNKLAINLIRFITRGRLRSYVAHIRNLEIYLPSRSARKIEIKSDPPPGILPDGQKKSNIGKRRGEGRNTIFHLRIRWRRPRRDPAESR